MENFIRTPTPPAWEVRRRAFDGALIVWRYTPDAERACQWTIVAVHPGGR